MKTKKIISDSNGSEQVAAFLEKLNHPLKKEIEEVRKIILSADKNLTEHIKWNAPSFCIQGDDRITFNFHGKDSFRLVFHCGAKAKDRKLNSRLFEDSTGLLEWVANDRATATFTDTKSVNSKKQALLVTVRTWIKLAT